MFLLFLLLIFVLHETSKGIIMKDQKSTVARNCHENNKKNLLKNTVKKANLTNKKLPYKQDLFAHAKKDSLTCIKKPRQIQRPYSHGKFPRKIPAGNSHNKFLQQILAANSHGKFLWQIPAANSQVFNAKVVWSILCARELHA